MSLYNWLMVNRTKEQLAKELAAEASKNAHLEDLVDKLQHQVFWMEAVDNTPELKPLLPFLNVKASPDAPVQRLTYDQFRERYIKAYSGNGDTWTHHALQSSWQAYNFNPAGHFISRETN